MLLDFSLEAKEQGQILPLRTKASCTLFYLAGNHWPFR